MPTQTYESARECAKISEQIERYPDMLEEAKQLVQLSYEAKRTLIPEDRNLLFVAYGNVIGTKRSCLRILGGLAATRPDDPLVQQKTAVLAKELIDTVDGGLALVDGYLLNPEENCDTEDAADRYRRENAVSYLKFKRDLWSYRTEALSGADRNTATVNASTCYEKATILSEKLTATNPVRLSLILNYSVHCYEVLADSTKAIAMTEKGFNDAIAELDSLPEDAYKTSTLLMQQPRDNLTLWTSEAEAG